MAYEVVRVHGLILSNIQDGEKDSSSGKWPVPESKYQMPRLSPDTPFLYDFPAELNKWCESSNSSSLESSTETETESDDEDDFIAGLAEQIAHSMLQDDETGGVPGSLDGDALTDVSVLESRPNAEPFKAVASLQSGWSRNSVSASRPGSVSSSKQSSQVSSPPSTPSTSEGDAWNLLNAAAGEVVRLKMDEASSPPAVGNLSAYSPGAAIDTVKQCNPSPEQPGVWMSQQDHLPSSNSPSFDAGTRSSAPFTGSKDRMMADGGPPHIQRCWTRPKDDDRKPCNNGQRLPRYDGASWNQRQARQGNPHKGVLYQKVGKQNHAYGGQYRTAGKPLDRNGITQRPGGQGVNGGSGMRAVFLGSAGSGRESGGTGVFLPRCFGGGPDHRRKPACSTVLLPSRIVQVLNLNVEDMRSHPSPVPAAAGHTRNDLTSSLRNSPHMYRMDLTAGTMKYECGEISTYPRKFQGPHLRQVPDVRRSETLEYSLPTEWTY